MELYLVTAAPPRLPVVSGHITRFNQESLRKDLDILQEFSFTSDFSWIKYTTVSTEFNMAQACISVNYNTLCS